jgi:hypothetical protein
MKKRKILPLTRLELETLGRSARIIIIIIIMALQLFVGPWLLLQILGLVRSR